MIGTPGRIATAIYTLTLRAFPRGQRAVYAAEMADAFRRELASRRAQGRWVALRFIVAAWIDGVRAGLGERRHQRRQRRFSRYGETMTLGISWLDVKLGFRMLRRFPGLTVAGGLALTIAIGLGTAWHDLSRDLFRPTLPLPGGDRIVEVEMRDSAANQDERRLLHDFVNWRRDVRSIEGLGAYRNLERNLILGDARPEAVTVAQISASAFRIAQVPPLLGRPLLESDEHTGAAPVVVIGYTVWQGRFSGRVDVVGQTVQLGTTKTTVIGVMPEGFAFPINHKLWTPLQLNPAGYAPLEGAGIRVFGRVAPGATQAQANAELAALADRTAAAWPATHTHLRPRVLAWGGESPGDVGVMEFVIKNLPVLLVLLIACANVATLIYARTATRDSEIAIRFALGASRGRIVSQLFVEALLLAAGAAVVGLFVANLAIKWGMAVYYSGGSADGMPFWLKPGLKFSTVLYAAVLTLAGAAILSILPALKITGAHAHHQLKNLGSGGSTLRFGWVWTSVMIVQVALTVICIPPAFGISEEALRDRRIRSAFPAAQYLAARVTLDRDGVSIEQTYHELERRVLQEPAVTAVTFADRLPGMGVAVRRAEAELSPSHPAVVIPNLWMASVGQGFFEAFRIPIVAGRDFHDGDRAPGATSVLVNEAFARRYLDGASPIGHRVRFASADPARPEPWSEIVGMVRDVGMTPTDLGEAPYVFRAVTPATASPLVMGVRVAGDSVALAQRLRAVALDLDIALRLEEVRSLDDHVWRQDVPSLVLAGALMTVVGLGLFLSAAGIFSLMSVSVARRTREIGLRAALGASQSRLLAGIFSRALVLVGSGVAAGNVVLLSVIYLSPEVTTTDVIDALLTTSAVMLTVGLLACAEPARRALRIQPTDALKEA